MSPLLDTSSLSEEALILRLQSTEHDFIERKARSDKRGWLQSAVAFANSAPIGWPAILFVGVNDTGVPQLGSEKLEDLSKSVGDVLDQAYPPIFRYIVPLHLESGACLAVVIPGSETRPHFAGKAYVRDGPQNKEASAQQFAFLIAQQNAKTRLILESKGKSVIVENIRNRGTHLVHRTLAEWIIEDCNQFFVIVASGSGSYSSPKSYRSFPLAWIELANENNRLKLIVEE